MSNQPMVPRAVAFRWLAQFFLCPPDLITLESYHSTKGMQFLTELRSDPALAELAIWMQDELVRGDEIAQLQTQISSGFTQAFDMGGPRAPLPYASVYLSEKGLLFQKPTRDMIGLLKRLQMQLPESVTEPADHLGVQLHVAAELIEREKKGQLIPVSSSEFLDQWVLAWLPEFAQRCENLPAENPVRLFAQTALKLTQDTVDTAELCRESV